MKTILNWILKHKKRLIAGLGVGGLIAVASILMPEEIEDSDLKDVSISIADKRTPKRVLVLFLESLFGAVLGREVILGKKGTAATRIAIYIATAALVIIAIKQFI